MQLVTRRYIKRVVPEECYRGCRLSTPLMVGRIAEGILCILTKFSYQDILGD
jgi:hypothetical protein